MRFLVINGHDYVMIIVYTCNNQIGSTVPLTVIPGLYMHIAGVFIAFDFPCVPPISYPKSQTNLRKKSSKWVEMGFSLDCQPVKVKVNQSKSKSTSQSHMEPKNHPIEKENNLNQTSIVVFHVNLPDCTKKKKPSLAQGDLKKTCPDY